MIDKYIDCLEFDSNNLKDNIVAHIDNIRKGKEKTFSFSTLEKAKEWLNN